MKTYLKKFILCLVVTVIIVFVDSTIAFAGSDDDWIEYDTNTGTEKIVSFNEIQTEGLPESLPASDPVGLRKFSTSGIGIIGEENRTKVIDTSQYPYSSVVRTIATGNGHSGGQGSGAMISNNLVLSCAHAVYNQKNGFANVEITPGNTTIEPGLPFGKAKSTKIYIPKVYKENPTIEEDIALIKLDSSIGYQTGWFGINYFDEYYSYDNFTVTGYPSMFGGDMYTENKETYAFMRDDYGKTIYSNFDATTGNSGSPLYNNLNQIRGVVVSYANEKDETVACIATNIDSNRFAFINHLINKPVEIEKISIEPNSVKVLQKSTDSQQLTVKFYPEDAEHQEVIWAVVDKQIAKISADGVVSGITEGETLVRATTKNGDFTATCKVIVGDDYPDMYPGTQINLDTNYSGKIDYMYDRDTFRFNTKANKQYVIESDSFLLSHFGYTLISDGTNWERIIDENPTTWTATNGKRYLGFIKPEDSIRGFFFDATDKKYTGLEYNFRISEVISAYPTIHNKKELREKVLKVGETIKIDATANNGAFPDSLRYSVPPGAESYVKINGDGELTALKPIDAIAIIVLDVALRSEPVWYEDKVVIKIVE